MVEGAGVGLPGKKHVTEAEISAVRESIESVSRQARLLSVDGEAGRAKSLVLTNLDQARLWLAELSAAAGHRSRP